MELAANSRRGAEVEVRRLHDTQRVRQALQAPRGDLADLLSREGP